MRFKLSFFLISLGIKLLPERFRNKTFVINCIRCNIIKIEQEQIKK